MSFWQKIAAGILGAAGLAVMLSAWFKPRNAWAGSDRVLVLGDSIVDSPGFLSSLREGFGPGVEIKKVSLPGKGTAPIKDAGLEAAHSWHPDLVIVLAGVNDLASGRGWEHAAANLDELYSKLNALDIYVAAVHLTPWTTDPRRLHLQRQRTALNEWISEHETPVAVVHTELVGYQGKDGLHLRVDGGKQLADATLYALEIY